MSPPGLVVVGASLAGLRAAESARRAGFGGTIALVGAEVHPPYDRPPLSKRFLTETAATPTFFRDAASLRDDLDVDLRLGTPVTALDTDARTVLAGDQKICYTSLVIATGAQPRTLPGMPRLAGVHTLRTVDDATALRRVAPGGTGGDHRGRVHRLGGGLLRAATRRHGDRR